MLGPLSQLLNLIFHKNIKETMTWSDVCTHSVGTGQVDHQIGHQFSTRLHKCTAVT